jgi:hypothetical protein
MRLEDREGSVAERPERGPWLIGALFCEAMWDESEQEARVPSTIRPANFARWAVDRASFTGDEPMELPMYLSLADGEPNRNYHVRLVVRDPVGKVQREDDYYVHFPGIPGAVIDTMVVVPVLPIRSGVFWTDVFLDDALLTRVPFRIELQFTG